MIDHISVPVKDFEKSRDFYDQTLSVLGFERVLNFEDETQQWAGYGTNGIQAIMAPLSLIPMAGVSRRIFRIINKFERDKMKTMGTYA